METQRIRLACILCMYVWATLFNAAIPIIIPAHSFSWNSATKLSCLETADTLDMSICCKKFFDIISQQ